MPILIVGLIVLAVLVWVGRRPERLGHSARLASALGAAGIAAAAVFAGLRGAWPVSVVMMAAAVWLGAGGRSRRGAGGAAVAAMSAEHARSILGVGPDATREEIDAAWRRLIQRTHPDQGGTEGLAAQLNAARDRLLK